MNGFIGAGYLAVPTLIGFGDWIDFLRGLHPYWLWRGALILVGIVLYLVIAAIALRYIEPFLGREPVGRHRRALTLTLIAYIAGGTAFCAAGAFNPVGAKLVLISAAAASFGGTGGLPWLISWAQGRGPTVNTPEDPVLVTRSWIWITFGLLSAAVLIGILGPGIRFKM